MYIDGVMNREWQDFFRELWNRVGGFNSISLSDVVESILSGLYETRVSTPTIPPDVIPTGKSYDRVLDELKMLFEARPSISVVKVQDSSFSQPATSKWSEDTLQFVQPSPRTILLNSLLEDVIFDDSANGLVLKDTQAPPHYWRVTIDNTGTLVITDLGTVKP